MDFRTESLADLAGRVRSKEVSARELTSHALGRIEALNPQVNAFVAVDGDRALAEAAAIDERVARGEDPGPLTGIPIGVKDLEDAAGFVTTHGSPVHADDPPAEQDSILVARLRARGCVVLGKTNSPEHGWKADTDNEVFGATRQSLGSGALGGRLLGRHGRCARGGHGAARDRIRWRGVDPHPVRDQRAVRPEALTGARPVGRPACAGVGGPLDEGPDGATHP